MTYVSSLGSSLSLPGRVACPIFITGCLHACMHTFVYSLIIADVRVIATSAKSFCISSDGAPPFPNHRTSRSSSSPKANLPLGLKLSNDQLSLPKLPCPPSFRSLDNYPISTSTRAKRWQAEPNRLVLATRLQSLPECHAGRERALRARRASERDESKTARLTMDPRRL